MWNECLLILIWIWAKRMLWFRDVMCLLCWSWTWVVFWLIFREQGWHQLEYCRCNLFRSVLWSCFLGVSCNVNYFRLQSFCLMVWANSPLGDGQPWVLSHAYVASCSSIPLYCDQVMKESSWIYFLLLHMSSSKLWTFSRRRWPRALYSWLWALMTKSTHADWRRNEKLTLDTKAHIL